MYHGVEPLRGFTASFCPNPVAFQAELFCFLDNGPETLVHIRNASLLIEWKLRSRAPKTRTGGPMVADASFPMSDMRAGSPDWDGEGLAQHSGAISLWNIKTGQPWNFQSSQERLFHVLQHQNFLPKTPPSLSLCFRLGRRLAGWRQSCRRKATRWHCSVGKWWWSSELPS